MRIERPRTTLVGLLLLLLPATLAAQAQTELPRQDDDPYQRHPEADKAIDELKSPYCPGLMLEVCPTIGGAALRDSIETLADQGWDSDRLVEWVIGNHGEHYRALPKREGKALVAWLVPPLAVLSGMVLVVVALRAMRRSRPSVPFAEAELSPEEEAKLKEALAELEAEEEVPFL